MDEKIARLIKSWMIPEENLYQEHVWQPHVDLYQGRDGWLLKFDLAGVRPQDLKVTVKGKELTIQGIRKDWSILEGQRCYSMEISYNRFSRTVEIPCDLDECEMKTDYREGMFMVMIRPRRSEE